MSMGRALKASLQYQAAAWVMTGLLVPSAHAQTAPLSGVPMDDTIVVSGARAENETIVNEKRNTVAIADFLSSDEAGKMPDLNIAESLSRIPGVSAVFDEDRARFVTVRGLKSSLNYTALDGIGIATADDFGGTGRQVNLEVIPPGAVGLLEVRKTFTPEVDGGAIGGYINLHTRSAFDRKRTGLVVQGGINLQTYKGVPDVNNAWGRFNSPFGGQIDATYTGRFGADEQFGIVVAGQFSQESRDESKNIQGSEDFYNDAGAKVSPLLADGSVNPAWNGLAVPREARSFDYTNRIRNFGGNAKLEYQGSNVYASLLGFYYGEDQRETRKMMQSFSMGNPRNLTPTSGDLTYGEIRTGWNSNTLNKTNAGAIARVTIDDDDGNKFNVVGGWSYAEFSDYQPLMDFVAKPSNRSVSYEVIGEGPRVNRFTFDDTDAIMDPANYNLLSFNELTRLTTEHVYNVKTSYAHNRGNDDYGFGFEVGADYKRIDRMRDNGRIDYRVGTTPLGDYGIQTNYQPDAINFPLLWVDGSAFTAWGKDNLAVNEAATAEQQVVSDYRYIEDTMATFAMLQYRGDRFYTVGGIRYENVATKAIAPNERLSDPFLTRKGGYVKWLPSAMASYDLQDNLVVKIAASQSLGRPNPGDIAQRERRNDLTYTITRGNPDLQPRVATNYDLSLEYYLPNRNGLLSLAVFHKDIKDEIYTQTSVETIDGAEYQVREPRNAEGSKVSGVELGAILNSFDFIAEPLKNLGFSGNLTYSKGSISYINQAGNFAKFNHLEDQPSWTGNASLFYEFGKKAEVRLSYNYRSEYHDAISTTAWTATGRSPSSQFGGYVRYNLSDDVAVKFKARNIFNANSQRIRGLGLDDLHEEVEYGQSFYLDLLVKF